MKTKFKDRLGDLLLILLFLGIVVGCAYFIMKTMVTWKTKGLG